MYRHRQNQMWLATLVALTFVLMFTACSKGFAPISRTDYLNQVNATTGYQAPDGKAHTGASGDHELEKLKDQIAEGGIESLSKIDRELATGIASAKIESASQGAIRVSIVNRDSTRLTFDFTDKEIAPKNAKDTAEDVRYKSVMGKTGEGAKANFELGLLCRKFPTEVPKPSQPGCQTATLSLKETAPNGAKAGLVIRNQDIIVLAKTTYKNLKHETLKRLISELQVAKSGTLQSFEVAWGPSGFALNFGDSQVCPVGRLVETNDLDEPLRLNCVGVQPFHDLEGRMIGNTTRGELLLQISAATPGIIYGETVEHIYMLVRKKPALKKPAPSTPTTPNPSTPTAPGNTTPGATAPATPTTPVVPPGANADDDDDSSEDPVFNTDRKPEERPAVTPGKTSETKGWMIPVHTAHPFTKTFAKDRKNPIIDRGIKTWLNSKALKSFAQNFLPNRTLVTNRLGASQVPAEFALILFGESTFFKQKGYPIEGPMRSSAWGPWQFLDDTAIGNGLRIHRRYVNKRFVPGNICDERADLGKATEAAGRYLRSIINMFPSDPKLVLLGYNQGEYGVEKKMTSLKNTGSQERLDAIKEIGLNYWTIRRFNMASSSGLKYVENFVSVYHAALESDPVQADPSVEPWKPNPQCRAM